MIYNPYPQIELPFGKDNKWFVLLFGSIIRIVNREDYGWMASVCQ